MAIRLRSRLRAGSSLYTTAALSLDFLSPSGALDPRITFSRGSQATLTDSTGKITYAPNNLLTNSQDFESANWVKDASTVSANAVAAPDGTTTADNLIESTASSVHRTSQFFTSIASVPYVASIYVKAVGSRRFFFNCSAIINSGALFDLTGSGSVVATTGTATNRAAGVTALANGWYRCYVTGIGTGTANRLWAQINQSTSSTATDDVYVGDGTSGLTLWGAQLEAVTYQTTPGTYNSTSPKNLLGYTQEFDNAAWSKLRATVNANSTPAPDGGLSADTLLDTAVAGTHVAIQAITKAAAAAPYAASVYVKKDVRDQGELRFSDQAGNGVRCTFNLTDGTVGTATAFGTGFAAGTAQIASVGNGWFRVSLTGTTNSATTLGHEVYIANAAGSTSYTGTGAGFYVWGAQLSNSASLDPYVYNPGAAPTSAAYYGPRFDYDPVTLAAKGLLIEEQRTNLVLQSHFAASWTVSAAVLTANSSTSPDGTSNAASLADNATSGPHVAFQTIGTTSSVTYTASVYAKAGTGRYLTVAVVNGLSTGSATATFDLQTGSVTQSGAYGAAATFISASAISVGGGWYRLAVVSSNTTSNITLQICGASAGTFTADVFGRNSYSGSGSTWLIWGAQLEAGAFATSYIPTVASQVTRSADVATMTGANFSNWYNQNEGTFAVNADTYHVASSKVFYAASDGGANNEHMGFVAADASVQLQTVVGGVTQSSLSVMTATANTPFRVSYAYKANNFAGCGNGGSVQTDASGTLPVVDRLSIGLRGNNTLYVNGHIRSISYYNTRLRDDELQVITG